MCKLTSKTESATAVCWRLIDGILRFQAFVSIGMVKFYETVPRAELLRDG
jgi:hypothetical protein